MKTGNQRKALEACVVVAALAGLTCGAMGQAVPPAPPAPPTTPRYVPPPPPPAPVVPPAPAPEPVVPTPDIVERDAKGNVVVYSVPADVVALGRLTLSEEKASLREQVKAERAARLEQRIAANATAALSVRSVLRNLDTMRMEDLMAMQRPVQAMNMQPSTATMLQQSGAITPRELEAVNAAVRNYDLVLRKNMEERLGAQSPEMRTWMVAHAVRTATLEGAAALERMLARAGERWAQIKAGLNPPVPPSPALEALEAQVQAAGSPGERAQLMEQVLMLLDDQQRTAVLTAVATPIPSNTVIPQAAPSAPVGQPQPVRVQPGEPRPGGAPTPPVDKPRNGN